MPSDIIQSLGTVNALLGAPIFSGVETKDVADPHAAQVTANTIISEDGGASLQTSMHASIIRGIFEHIRRRAFVDLLTSECAVALLFARFLPAQRFRLSLEELDGLAGRLVWLAAVNWSKYCESEEPASINKANAYASIAAHCEALQHLSFLIQQFGLGDGQSIPLRLHAERIVDPTQIQTVTATFPAASASFITPLDPSFITPLDLAPSHGAIYGVSGSTTTPMARPSDWNGVNLDAAMTSIGAKTPAINLVYTAVRMAFSVASSERLNREELISLRAQIAATTQSLIDALPVVAAGERRKELETTITFFGWIARTVVNYCAYAVDADYRVFRPPPPVMLALEKMTREFRVGEQHSIFAIYGGALVTLAGLSHAATASPDPRGAMQLKENFQAVLLPIGRVFQQMCLT